MFRLAAAGLAFRLYRVNHEWRFGIVTFVLAVTAAFPVVDLLNPQVGFFKSWLVDGGGIAVLLTALILVRTLTDLSAAYKYRLMEQLDLRSRAELTQYAVKHGVVSPA